ncbi:MAG: hypothetical protein CME64_17915 [Halobacteriovoraceae bacterium]|nr:hypothetical protein [Halobacteriovoraceae bacterium]|tara:strand:+ start:25199 stop:25651 length:453 start_codon:yes stop_codon:yes gene_type:complete
MKLKVVLMVIVIIVALLSSRLYMLGNQSQEVIPDLGHQNGQLAACPDKPNCVSSQEQGEAFVQPFDKNLTVKELKKSVLSIKGAKLEKEGEGYLRFSFKSDIFGFVDDLELVKGGQAWHIRSSSRVGYSDMNANRERVEKLRQLIMKNIN